MLRPHEQFGDLLRTRAGHTVTDAYQIFPQGRQGETTFRRCKAAVSFGCGFSQSFVPTFSRT
jgi:hypothetical protein